MSSGLSRTLSRTAVMKCYHFITAVRDISLQLYEQGQMSKQQIQQDCHLKEISGYKCAVRNGKPFKIKINLIYFLFLISYERNRENWSLSVA